MTDEELLLRAANRIDELKEMIGRNRPVKPSLWCYAQFLILLICGALIMYWDISDQSQNTKHSISNFFVGFREVPKTLVFGE